MKPAELAAAIAALPGEKITRELIESRVVSCDFISVSKTVTICSLLLDNGYSVRGESACVDPANYRPEIGEAVARSRAVDALWPLFGFLLAEARFQKTKIA